jgi:hypothetical protein
MIKVSKYQASPNCGDLYSKSGNVTKNMNATLNARLAEDAVFGRVGWLDRDLVGTTARRNRQEFFRCPD